MEIRQQLIKEVEKLPEDKLWLASVYLRGLLMVDLSDVETEKAVPECVGTPLHIIERRKKSHGCLEGKVWMADDFNAPLEELKEYM